MPECFNEDAEFERVAAANLAFDEAVLEGENYVAEARSINDVARRCYKDSLFNGWDVCNSGDFSHNAMVNKCAAKLALIHSEVSECLEALRKGDNDNGLEEMADAVIRIFEFCHGCWPNQLGNTLVEKMARNRVRGYRHRNDSGAPKRL